jgi:hypothetical protein
MYHRVFSTHLEQVVLALHTAQLILNGGYKNTLFETENERQKTNSNSKMAKSLKIFWHF